MKHLLILVSLLLCSCASKSSKEVLVRDYGFTQGTTYHISYMSSKALSYKSDIDSVLQAVDKSMSTYIDSSIISKINRNESYEVDTLFLRVFETAQMIAKQTQGAFDPTIAPMVNYWGFGFEKLSNENKEDFADLKNSVGYQKISIEKGKVKKLDLKTQLDFNAIAQGFTVDLVAEHLEKVGIVNYMVEIGGEVKCKGLNAEGNLWQIGVDKTSEIIQEERFEAIIEVENTAVASSGNYRKFKVDETTGMKYAHTINPYTGKPAKSNLLGVTIVTESCMVADATATAFMVMGLKASKKYLEKNPELEALLVYSDSKGNLKKYTTKGFKKIQTYSSD